LDKFGDVLMGMCSGFDFGIWGASFKAKEKLIFDTKVEGYTKELSSYSGRNAS